VASKESQSSSRPAPQPEARLSADPYAEIVQLARQTPSKARFMSDVTRCVVRAFASPYGAIHVRYASEVVQDENHTGPTDPQFWKPSLQQFLTESLTEGRPRAKLLKAKSGQAKVAFLSAPIFDPSGPAIGAMAVVVAVVEDSDWSARLATLEALCRLASVCVEFLGLAESGSPAARASDRATFRAASAESAEELAFTITNELRNKLGCEQVSLGLVSRNRVRILSISGLDQVNRRSPGVAGLRAAMEECLDADTMLVCPRPGDWFEKQTFGDYHLHKQWHAAAKADAVASIPLRVDGSPAAILSLRSRADRPLSREQLEDVGKRTEAFVPALLLARRAGRSLPRHAVESVRASLAALTAPGRWGRKIVAGVAAAATLGFFLGSMDHRLTVPCTVTPAQVRHVAAPFAGVLTAAFALQGDRVRQGDILCQFDHEELDQQRIELNAQREVLEREMDRAMARHSPSEAQLALANLQLAQAKLDIIDGRLARTAVRSPIDGVIVFGDLRKLIGAVVPQGQPLFQVASPNQWTLELEIPESAAGDLSDDLAGVFASYARPQETRSFRISRVLPTAQIRHGKNVYVAEADVGAAGGAIRPGMEGVAKVSVGPRKVWWIASHRVLDYLRMTFWL